MAVQKIDVKQFLSHSQYHPVIDVRSPSEYLHAHIPGAVNFPLFSDEERKQVGTLYKQRSREEAIKLGLDYFGPKMRNLVEEVEKLVASLGFSRQDKLDAAFQGEKCVLVHCWRGGMRSGAVAWLLDLYGFKVFTLSGGYKTYRHHVLDSFELSYPFRIVGGYTGSGKTYILRELKRSGQEVIDLEGLAHHKGSAFGALGQPPQPSQEMFENLLSAALEKALQNLQKGHIADTIWLEDESMRIGSVNLPIAIWNQMRSARVLFLDIPFEQRLDYLVQEYGSLDTEKMVNAIIRISKRLGGLETKTAINYLLEGNKKGSFEVLLKYYDKQYLKGLHNRPDINEQVLRVEAPSVDSARNATSLLNKNQTITTV